MFRLLIASAPSAGAGSQHVWHEKHDMPNVRPLLFGTKSEFVDGRPGRFDESRDRKKDHVQRGRRGDLPQRPAPTMRQMRRARRELVKLQHDKRSGKADTDGTWPMSEAKSLNFNVRATQFPRSGIAAAPRLYDR